MRRSPKSAPRPRLRLREARTQRNWSQQDVADRIGTMHLNVSRWQRGPTKHRPYFRSKLCSLFGKSEQELDLVSTPSFSVAVPAVSASYGALYDSAIPNQPAIHLVGRDSELNYLKKRLLTSGNVALTALNGQPGVGKTALAIELVHDQEIRAHFSEGILWEALGAETSFHEGLALACRTEDRERFSALLADLGWVTWKQGKYSLSETQLQEGLNLARQLGNRERISGLLETLGSVAASRGDYALSEKYLQEGLEIAQGIGDREQICAILINLGTTAGEQGIYPQEEAYYREGLDLARQIGHREWISLLLMNLGEMIAEQ